MKKDVSKKEVLNHLKKDVKVEKKEIADDVKLEKKIEKKDGKK